MNEKTPIQSNPAINIELSSFPKSTTTASKTLPQTTQELTSSENLSPSTQILYYDDYIYGNDISTKKPFKMGNLYTLFFISTHPIISIGCNSGKQYIYINI